MLAMPCTNNTIGIVSLRHCVNRVRARVPARVVHGKAIPPKGRVAFLFLMAVPQVIRAKTVDVSRGIVGRRTSATEGGGSEQPYISFGGATEARRLCVGKTRSGRQEVGERTLQTNSTGTLASRAHRQFLFWGFDQFTRGTGNPSLTNCLYRVPENAGKKSSNEADSRLAPGEFLFGLRAKSSKWGAIVSGASPRISRHTILGATA